MPAMRHRAALFDVVRHSNHVGDDANVPIDLGKRPSRSAIRGCFWALSIVLHGACAGSVDPTVSAPVARESAPAPVPIEEGHVPSPVAPAPVQERHAPSPVAPAPVQEASVWKVLSRGVEPLEDRLLIEIAVATASKLIPVVYLCSTWVPACATVEESRRDPRMVEALRGTYIIELDSDHWQHAEFDAVGIYLSTIPFFYVMDGTAHAVRKIGPDSWGLPTAENMAPALTAFFAAK
jgi:hypothetical protein